MTTSKLNQAEFAATVKSQRDNLDKIIHRLKSIAVNRYVIEGNNQYADERDSLLNELSRIEAEIPKIKSDAEMWINMQQKDISQIERNISRANGVREKLELQKMNNTKKSEIEFLKQQITFLDSHYERLKELIKNKPNHAYFYSYRMERTINHGSYHPSSIDAEELYITAHPSKILLKLKIYLPEEKRRELEDGKRHLRAFLSKDNTVFISRKDAYPRELGIGRLLLKALESQLSPGTEISLEAEGDSPGYWQKMGFSCDFSTKICHKLSNY
jgi:hypothetical protein